MRVIKRNGQEVEFDKQKIIDAMTNAFMETEEGIDEDPIQDIADEIEEEIGELVYYPTVESIQDMVEEALMSSDMEQAVLNQEIYAQGNNQDTGVFGYQERYAEYRYKPYEILGQFMSTVTRPLDMWHLGQVFQTLPVLNGFFIEQNTSKIS